MSPPLLFSGLYSTATEFNWQSRLSDHKVDIKIRLPDCSHWWARASCPNRSARVEGTGHSKKRMDIGKRSLVVSVQSMPNVRFMCSGCGYSTVTAICTLTRMCLAKRQ
jgi:hypothetical protein